MENSIYQGGNNAFLHFTDGAGHPGLSVHQGSLPRARHGVRVKTNALFHYGPMSGLLTFKRITVSDVAPA